MKNRQLAWAALLQDFGNQLPGSILEIVAATTKHPLADVYGIEINSNQILLLKPVAIADVEESSGTVRLRGVK